MKVPFATFVPMHNEIRKELDAAYAKVLDTSYFIWIIWRFSTANPLIRYHKSERPVPSFQ